MPVLPEIIAMTDELTEIFEDLHANPEIGFEEERTAAIVADRLRAWGVDEVHTGIGKTGVVGIVRGKGKSNRRIGLRADMDALPLQETTGLPYASVTAERMHACGHDGHTTMLLGAARYLAQTRDFSGTAVLVFQPAEEGLGGARAMLAEGLLERFPCDEIYGMHNWPDGKPQTVGICRGAATAGASFFDITVNGKGSHAANPHEARDALLVATGLVQQMQSVVSRNVPATDMCVLSVTQIHGGSAYNVLPETVTVCGSLRFFSHATRDLVQSRIRELCAGIGTAYNVRIAVEFREIFDVLVNDDSLTDAYLQAAADIVGEANISDKRERGTGSEDFADMLKTVPGAYCMLGHAGTVPLHNPGFVLDVGILPVGASIMARVVERRLPL